MALLTAATGERISLSALDGFRQPFERLAFDGDGALVAAGRFDVLRIGPDDVWQLAQWSEPPLGYYAIVHFALSPDASLLALTSPWGASGRVVVRDVRTGAVVDAFGTDVHFADSLTWSPDASLLAVTGHSTLQGPDHIGLWDRHARAGAAASLSAAVHALAFSHSGERLAAGDGLDVTLRDAKTGVLLRRGEGGQELRFHGHGSGVSALAFSPSDGELVSGDNRGDLRLWDVRAGTQKEHFDGHRDVVSAIAFTRDGARFATASRDGTVALWRASEPRAVRAWKAADLGISDVVFSPDESSVVTCGNDGTIRWWAVETGGEPQRSRTVSPPSRSVAFIGARTLVVSDGVASRVLDLDRKNLSSTALPGRVTGVGALGNDRLAVRSGEDSRLVHGAVVNGAWHSSGALELDGIGTAFHEAGPTPWPRGLAVSAKGTYVGAAARGALWVWRIRDGKRVLRRFADVIAGPVFSPNEDRVAWLDAGGLAVVAIDGGALVREARSSGSELRALAYVDDATIELGTRHGQLLAFDLASRSISVTGALGSSIERLVAGARTGILLAVLDDGSVGIRRSGVRTLAPMTRCPPPVDLTLSPDETLVAVACAGRGAELLDGTVQVWSIAGTSPVLMVALRALADTDAGVLFSSDGHFDFVGQETDRARDALRCRSGPYFLPLDVCERRYRDRRLLTQP